MRNFCVIAQIEIIKTQQKQKVIQNDGTDPSLSARKKKGPIGPLLFLKAIAAHETLLVFGQYAIIGAFGTEPQSG